MATDVKSKGSEDFDFMGENSKTKVAGAKSGKPIDDETATSGNPEEESEQEKLSRPKEIGSITREITLEARRRSNTPKGLDISAFVQEFKLLDMDVEHVLNGPLPTE